MDGLEILFRFQGLHVDQRAQEARTAAKELATADPLWTLLQAEVRLAALGIAGATARSRQNADFVSGLEETRAAIHAAGAIADQLEPRGTPVDPRATPPQAAKDREVTRTLAGAGHLLDIPLHDHVILGGAGTISAFGTRDCFSLNRAKAYALALPLVNLNLALPVPCLQDD